MVSVNVVVIRNVIDVNNNNIIMNIKSINVGPGSGISRDSVSNFCLGGWRHHDDLCRKIGSLTLIGCASTTFSGCSFGNGIGALCRPWRLHCVVCHGTFQPSHGRHKSCVDQMQKQRNTLNSLENSELETRHCSSYQLATSQPSVSFHGKHHHLSHEHCNCLLDGVLFPWFNTVPAQAEHFYEKALALSGDLRGKFFSFLFYGDCYSSFISNSPEKVFVLCIPSPP